MISHQANHLSEKSILFFWRRERTSCAALAASTLDRVEKWHHGVCWNDKPLGVYCKCCTEWTHPTAYFRALEMCLLRNGFLNLFHEQLNCCICVQCSYCYYFLLHLLLVSTRKDLNQKSLPSLGCTSPISTTDFGHTNKLISEVDRFIVFVGQFKKKDRKLIAVSDKLQLLYHTVCI